MRRYLALISMLLLVSCVRPVPLDEMIERNREFERLMAKSVLLLRAGDDKSLSEAEAALNLAAELRPGSARVTDGLGALAWRRREYDTAKELFLRATQEDPAYARALAHLALAEKRQGNVQRAEELYAEALKLTPLDYRIRGNYGALLLDAGKVGASRDELMKALHSAPADDQEVLIRNIRSVERCERSGSCLKGSSP